MIDPDVTLEQARNTLDWLENQPETEDTKIVKDMYIEFIQNKIEEHNRRNRD